MIMIQCLCDAMESVIDLVKESEDLEKLADFAVDVAVSEGVVFRKGDSPELRDTFQHAPFMLFPSPIPR